MVAIVGAVVVTEEAEARVCRVKAGAVIEEEVVATKEGAAVHKVKAVATTEVVFVMVEGVAVKGVASELIAAVFDSPGTS